MSKKRFYWPIKILINRGSRVFPREHSVATINKKLTFESKTGASFECSGR